MSAEDEFLTIEEAEDRIERTILRTVGHLLVADKSEQTAVPKPIFRKDSKAQIEHDFPSIFGKERKAEP